MKKLAFLLSLTCFAVFAVAQKQHLTLTPAQPKQGEKISITYDPAGTPLENKTGIEIAVFNFGPNKNNAPYSVQELKLRKEGQRYAAEFVPAESAAVLVFKISADELKDGNFGKGYLTVINDNAGKPANGAYAALHLIYDGYGKYLADMDNVPEKAFEYAEKTWNEFPADRLKNMSTYVNALFTKKKMEAEPEVKAIIAKYKNDPKLEEAHYQTMARWYTRLKDKASADALLAVMKEKFPNGTWKQSEANMAVYNAKTAAEKEEALNKYLAAYPPKTELEKETVNYMMRSVANAYGAATDQVNVTKFKEWGEKLPVEMKTSLYNDVSWNWALKDMQMETAKMISEEATRYAKNEVSAPTQKKPETITTSQWDKSRKNTYGMFADTYGFIMYKLGKYQEAYPYLKDAAIDVQQAKNAEYNERYALILEKVETPAKIKAALEPMVREGKSTEKVKEILRNAYVKSNASGNVSAYIDELVKEADAKKLEEIRKTMLKYEAAGFVLKNMEGTPVSLASLKGKVVVVDFWATWCGPCKASFPAMQKMVDKYRNDKNVEFLFVDTWENGDDRLKNVKQFIADNKYSFHVLMDDPKKDNADEFTVVSNYKVDGIPTKFVIDGEGNVRFKSVGYQGSVDALMTELTSMIELARTNK